MKVVHRGKLLTLDDGLLLGQGGEARVYRHPSLPLALKIFHEIEPSLPPAERALRERVAALRVEKLRLVVGKRLPAAVIAPAELLFDKHDDVVGYAMARVDHAVDIAVLAHKKNKAAAAFDQSAVLAIFRLLRATVAELHKLDVIVGDLNDGNVLVAQSPSGARPCVIDADSMQLGALPCPVAHERFLDPRLFGMPLVESACFDVDSDHYALRVLLFQSLLCLHPFGGVHPKLPTLLRRAEARWSVLRGDVQLPRAAVSFTTLSDDLLHDFGLCFDRGERAPLDERLLETRFTMCSCGVEHARKSCPACSTAVQAPAIRTAGGVREESVLQTRGTILQARIVAGQLAHLVDERGAVRRDNGDVVLEGARPQGSRTTFEIAGDATWLGHGSRLVKLRGGALVDRALTSTLNGAPVFAAGSAGLFVLEGDALVHHETRTRIGRVIEGQTSLVSSPEDGGLAFFRAGRMLVAYAFSLRGGFVDADVLQPEGKLVDVQVSFAQAGAHVLVGIACDVDGKRVHSLTLLDGRGRRVASAKGEPSASPILESIGGKLLVTKGDRVAILSASSAGVVAVDVDANGGRLQAGALFEDTRPFVDATVDLLPGSAGSLVVVSPQAITRIRLSGRSTTAP